MKHYDFVLVLLTVVLLVVIGGLVLAGALYSASLSFSNPDWVQTSQYERYIIQMNSYLLPTVVGLVIVLVLCIPKRVIPRVILLQLSGALVFVGLMLSAIWGAPIGLGFLLGVAGVIQLVTMVSLFRRRSGLFFERDGFWLKIGSTLLHLGLVVFLFDFVLLAKSGLHLVIFWPAAFLITLGLTLVFYPGAAASVWHSLTGRTIVDEDEGDAGEPGSSH